LEFVELLDAERLASYAEDERGITAAIRTNWAFADPKKLEGEGQALEARIRKDQDPKRKEAGLVDRDQIDLLARVLRRRRGRRRG
jgi:hypothetical protein